jgi:hypothetical protein
MKHNDPYGGQYCSMRLGVDDFDLIDDNT